MKEDIGNEFHIEFNTVVGGLFATKVTLESVFVKDTDTVRVDLCDHPLYKKLEQYVLANRS